MAGASSTTGASSDKRRAGRGNSCEKYMLRASMDTIHSTGTSSAFAKAWASAARAAAQREHRSGRLISVALT